MELEELRVLITAQTSGLRSELNNVRSQLNGLNKATDSSTAAISGAFTKLKAALIALGIGKVIKDSITEGMNAIESENLFSVSLGNMSDQAREWSQNLQSTLGLNGYDVRKNLGVLYTMTTSIGLAQNAAYGLSSDMTKLAYDMASFYNISDEDAFTKIRAGLVGEVEPLRQLGIIVDDATITQYAYSTGIAKTGETLTNQQKVMARYEAILAQTSNAQGDLARTIDSPANQLRLLKTNLQLLETELGKAFLPIAQVVIPQLTNLVKALSTTMSYVSQFTQSLFGNAIKSVATNIDDTTASTYNGAAVQKEFADSVSATGDAANKTAKELKGLMAFDEINALSKQKDDTSTSSTPTVSTPDLSNANSEFGNAAAALQPYIDKVKELAGLFKDGFKMGFGDTNFDGIKTSLSGIKDSLLSIFGDSGVQEAAKHFIDTFVYSTGEQVGALSRIGVTIADNILGGINLSLQQNREHIKQWLINMFNIGSDIETIKGNFAIAVANIFSVFSSDTAKQITADFITGMSNAFMGSSELFLKIGRDILNLITKPIIDNQEGIKTALEQTLTPTEKVTGATSRFITGMWDSINQVYDAKVKPTLDGFANSFSGIVGNFVNLYNTYLAPVLDDWGNKFSDLMDNHVKPFADNVANFLGSAIQLIGALYNTYVAPAIEVLQSVLIPILAPAVQFFGDTVINVIGVIIDLLGGVIKTFQGVLDFLTGVFTGDWSKVWQGINEITQAGDDMLNGILNGIKNQFADVLKYISNMASGIVDSIGSYFSFMENRTVLILNNISNILGGFIGYVAGTFASEWNNAWAGMANAVGSIFSGIGEMLKAPLNYVIDQINYVIQGFDSLSGINIPGIGTVGINIPEIPRLAQGGIVDSGQLFVAGEAGKEAIMPLENNTGWINELASKINALIGNNSDSNGDIIFQIGSDIIGKAALEYINKLRRKNGQAIISI